MTDIKLKLKDLHQHILTSEYASQINLNFISNVLRELLNDYVIIKKDTLKYRLKVEETTENWTLDPRRTQTVLTCELPLKTRSAVYDTFLGLDPDIRKKALDEMKEELLQGFCDYLENKCD